MESLPRPSSLAPAWQGRPERLQAYSTLARTADEFPAGHEQIDKGARVVRPGPVVRSPGTCWNCRSASVRATAWRDAAGRSYSEQPRPRAGRGRNLDAHAHRGRRLAARRHPGRHPEAPEELLSAAGGPPAAEPGKLWTPDSGRSAAKGGKIWTPGYGIDYDGDCQSGTVRSLSAKSLIPQSSEIP